jgi:hypothetical protein
MQSGRLPCGGHDAGPHRCLGSAGTAGSAAAIIGSLAGTALLHMSGPGRSLRLEVKLNAELDGQRFFGHDYGPIVARPGDERPANIVNRAFEKGFHWFDQARAVEKAKPQTKPAAQEPVAGDPVEK